MSFRTQQKMSSSKDGPLKNGASNQGSLMLHQGCMLLLLVL